MTTRCVEKVIESGVELKVYQSDDYGMSIECDIPPRPMSEGEVSFYVRHNYSVPTDNMMPQRYFVRYGEGLPYLSREQAVDAALRYLNAD